MARLAIMQERFVLPAGRNSRMDTPYEKLPLLLRPEVPFSDDELFDFCSVHEELQIEQDANGDIIVMPPTGGYTGRRNYQLGYRFGLWAEPDGSGVTFDSSTGFRLPNGAMRSPDLAWVRRERWEALSDGQRAKFIPLCPDFAIELRSQSDLLGDLQDKCAEYIANGASLVWLVDPFERRVHVYRGEAVSVLEAPDEILGDFGDSSDSILAGLKLDLADLW